MAEEIGNLVAAVTLDVTGFQNGVSTINRQLRVVQSEFQAAAAKLGDFGDSVDSLKLKADTLNKQIDLQRQKVAALEAAFQQSADKKGADAKATQDLQIKLNKAVAQLATMENELRKTNAEIEDQSNAWKKLSSDVSSVGERIKTSVFGIGNIIKSSLVFGAVYQGLQALQDGFRGVIGSGIEFNANMQENEIAFTQMLGSAEKAKAMLQDLTQFAATTPFELPQVEDAAKKLLAFGFSAEQVKPMLTAIGDAAAGLGLGAAGVDRITIALGQMAAKGKVQSDEMLQLVEAGIPAWDILAKAIGVSTSQLQDMVSKGTVPANQAIQALVAGMEERFPHMMDAQSKSFTGLMSNLKDNMNQVFGAVMKPTFDWLTNTALPRAVQLTNDFMNALKSGGIEAALKTIMPAGLVDELVAFGNTVKDVFGFLVQHGEEVKVILAGISAMFVANQVLGWVAAIKEAGGAINILTSAFKALNLTMLANPYVLAAAAIAMAAVLIYQHWDQIRAFLAQTWNAIATTAQTVWSGITGFFAGVWNGVTTAAQTAWNGIVSAVTGAWNAITGIFQSAWNAVGPIITAGWENIKTIFTAYFQTIWSVVSAAWETIKTIFAAAILVIYDLVTGQWDKIGQVFQAAGEKLWSIVSGLWDQIKQIWSGAFQTVAANTFQAWEQVKGLFSTAWNNLVQIVSNLWNDIKQWFINAGENIKATVSNMWTAVVNFFLSAPSRIAQAMASLGQALTNAWNQFKTEALNAGSDLIRGFINGIWNLASWAETQIKNFFGSAVQWAKHVLGIASPSKVFAEIGGNIAQGLAVGIQDESGTAIAAVTALANQITDQFEASSSRLEAAQNELAAAQARLAEIQRQQQEEKDRQERASLEQDIANAQARQQIVRQEIANLQQKLAAYEQQQKDTASIKQEIARQEQQLTELQQTEAEKRRKLAQMETQAQIDAAQARVDALKKEQDALKQEQDLLSQMQDVYAKFMTDTKAAWDDYEKKIADVNAKLAADIKKANDDLQKAIDDRAKSLRDFVGLFDAVQPKDVTGAQLLDNLRGQVQTFEQWQANLQQLADRGVDQGLLDELRQMGPKAAAEIAALNTLTDSQLSEYVNLWRRKNEDAKQEATTQLSDLAAQTQAKIADLRSQAAQQLEQYRQEWAQKTQQIHDDTVKKLEDLVQQASKQGFDMVAKLAQAIEQALPQLSEAMSGIPGLGAGAGGQDQVSQAQKQTTGVVQAAQTQKQGVVTANVEMMQTVLQTWTDGSAQIAARQNEIRDKTLTTWQQIQQQLSALWQKMYVDMQKKWNDMKKFLFDTADQVQTRFENLVAAAQRWGVDLMGNFIAGIWSQFSRLQETLLAMTMMVDSYMPHSPAKVGPLSRLDEWGPALVETFAAGIRSSLPSLEDVISRMAALSPAALGPALAGSVSSTTINNGGNTIYLQVSGSTARDQAEEIMRELRRMGVRI